MLLCSQPFDGFPSHSELSPQNCLEGPGALPPVMSVTLLCPLPHEATPLLASSVTLNKPGLLLSLIISTYSSLFLQM